ncbi:MAG: hypothetical protein Q9160_007254 [Pyrenula sp. 1 TL-2023]
MGIEMSNGLSLPQVHLGVYLTSGSETSNAVKWALEAGYRGYIYVLSSLRGSYDAARKSITKSIQASGLQYIDLFLLHSPYGGKARRLECWRAVEDAIDAGEVRTGGVSNFGVKHLQELLDSRPRIKPAVNQIKVLVRTDSLVLSYVPLPKSVKKERIVENGAIDGIEITLEDMNLLDSLDEYLVTDWDPVDTD